MQITKFVYDTLFKTIVVLTHLEETAAVSNETEKFLSRITTLEPLFATLPSGVDEQRHRNKLIQYAVATPTVNSVLSSFQVVQEDGRATEIFT